MRISILFRLYLGDAGSRDARVDAIVCSRSNVVMTGVTVETDRGGCELLGLLDDETMKCLRYELVEEWLQRCENGGVPQDWPRDQMEGA